MTLKTTIYAGIAADLTVGIDKGARRHRLGKRADILLATGTGASPVSYTHLTLPTILLV